MLYKANSCRLPAAGGGLLNSAINKLPFELHLPKYNFCGPGTRLEKRLARGDSGINPLDAACKNHDIAYSISNNRKIRNQADLKLAEEAWKRVKATDSSLGEKTYAWFVTNLMKAKAKLGMGLKSTKTKGGKKTKKSGKGLRKSPKNRTRRQRHRPKNILNHIIKKTKDVLKEKKPQNLQSAIKVAIAEAKKNVIGEKLKQPLTRIIPIPKTGGIIPFLLPLFAGLSALGSLGGGVATIAKAINNAKQAQKNLEESKRHNNQMEALAIGKGLFLGPYRKGLGLYLNPKNY